MLNNTLEEEQKVKSVDSKPKSIVNGYVRSLLLSTLASNKHIAEQDKLKEEEEEIKEADNNDNNDNNSTEEFENEETESRDDETQIRDDETDETDETENTEEEEEEKKSNSEEIETEIEEETMDIDNNNDINDTMVDINDNKNTKIIDIILSYYDDKLLLNTNIYTEWRDLLQFDVVSQNELTEIKDYYEKLVEQGYNKKRLPKYELLRYYFGTSKDINRALNKWKGSIDTYSYYKLANITNSETKDCLQKLSKSCHFCGYHGVKTGKPSPVFVLNYENWNWNDFDDLNHVIKASFYICSWMTDSIQAIQNGITLMINSTGVRFHHIKKAMSLLRAVQKSLALRTNNVFFLNLPSLAKNSMKLFLKIYPRHIQDKIHICSDTQSLFDVLDEDQIPSIFGGTLDKDPSNDTNDLKSLATLLSSYVDYKDFKHFDLDASDYDYDSDQPQQDQNEDDDQQEIVTDEEEDDDDDDEYSWW